MATKRTAWKRNAVTSAVDEDGLRKVNLPSLTHVGITNAERDAIFAFERPILGTMKATIRVNMRSQNHSTFERDSEGNRTGGLTAMKVLPKRLAEAGAIPDELQRFYDAKSIAANAGVIPAE